MDQSSPPPIRKGRGAVSNAVGRFEPLDRVAIDDGWGSSDEPPPPLTTSFTIDSTRTIIARNESPDIGFDRSINPYRGCEHGCVYCFARPTHAYLGLSPGLDFESRIFVKPEAAKLLAVELDKPGYVCRPMAMGTNTDPYQPAERKFKVTRSVLEVLRSTDHPVCIVTKSALIQRDIDILAPMAAKGLASVSVSITTLNRGLARTLEPRAAAPERRLETVAALAGAGIPTGVLAAPMIPALNDSELEAILAASREAGASHAGYVVLRLPLELKALFREWLEAHVPDKAKHVMSLVAAMHGGQTYDAQWGRRMSGVGHHAALLRARFELACKRLGLRHGGNIGQLDTTLFRPPTRASEQLRLL